MKHHLVLNHQCAEYCEWKCPACDRTVRAGRAGIKIIKPGNQEVNHGTASNMAGFRMNGASVEARTVH